MEEQKNRTLHYEYRMEITYSEPSSNCHFTIKCFPVNDARQQLLGQRITIEPEVTWSTGSDGFGNRQIYGSVPEPHDSFVFEVTGEVMIGQILYEEAEDEDRTLLFRHSHGMNRPGEKLRWYYDGLDAPKYENPYERAVYLMHCLYRDFTYRPGTTGVSTTAEEAWRQGTGVCQDYAHIFIALCHLSGIPARYVTGMMIGEGASHAWAEILYHGKWIGMDPTNNVLVADSHIKVGHGRDASDCRINLGIMHGGGNQGQRIRVYVTEG